MNQHVRIVHLTSVHSPYDLRIFHKESQSLVRASYQVTLVAPHERDELKNGVRIKAVSKPTGRLARMTCTVWQIYQEAVRLNADVYHFHDTELIPAGLLLRAKGKKVIYDLHEDLPRAILAKQYLPQWLRMIVGWLVERVENTACRWFSALVIATPAIAQRFSSLNNHAVVVQNFPLLKELASPVAASWDHRACAVAYVGSISENRGIRQMVETMGLLQDKFHVTLKLAGSFVPMELRDEMVQMYGWKSIEELGYIDRAAVACVLRQVRVGLVLIHPEPRYQVAYPVKMFEYMSAAIPVIVSDFLLWRQIIDGAGCGLLVDPLNSKDIAEAIEYLLMHPHEAEAMGRRGREAVEKWYNWESEEQKLLQLYAVLTNSIGRA